MVLLLTAKGTSIGPSYDVVLRQGGFAFSFTIYMCVWMQTVYCTHEIVNFIWYFGTLLHCLHELISDVRF
jgi:hypothetical protein